MDWFVYRLIFPAVTLPFCLPMLHPRTNLCAEVIVLLPQNICPVFPAKIQSLHEGMPRAHPKRTRTPNELLFQKAFSGHPEGTARFPKEFPPFPSQSLSVDSPSPRMNFPCVHLMRSASLARLLALEGLSAGFR